MRSITARQSDSRVTSSTWSTPGRRSASPITAMPPAPTTASATTEAIPGAAPATSTILSRKRSIASPDRVAAIEREIGARGEAALVRQQIDRQGGDLPWRAEAVERDVAADARPRAGGPAGGSGGVVEHRALDERRGDRVAAHRR